MKSAERATTDRLESPIEDGALEPDLLENVALMLERSHDTNCARCGYELHPTVLAGHDRCPECGARIVLSVAHERTDLGRLLPLVVSLSIAVGSGLTFPLYCVFEMKRIEWEVLGSVSVAYAMVNVILLTIAVRFRRQYTRLPRPARFAMLLVIWCVFFVFWRWWTSQPF